jgi:hypothetical protein
MPVTAKLSERFYDVLGEEIANELVVRELNELNFARFDAKLEQRVAEMCGPDSVRNWATSQAKWRGLGGYAGCSGRSPAPSSSVGCLASGLPLSWP